MRIDAHQHFWKYDPVRDAWIDKSMKVIQKDFLPNDLLPILTSNNIEGCIAVQADESEEENDFLLCLADESDFIKGVVGWLDFFDEDFDEKLAFYSQHKSLKGLRHILQGKTKGFFLQDKFKQSLGKLGRYNLTYDCLVFENQLSEVIELVKHFPNQRFVLDHIGKPKISLGVDENWVANVKQLSQFKNVYCKISGMVTETENWNWVTADFYSFMDVVVNAFGVDRILFGSDWPVCNLAAKYEQVLAIVTSYFKDYSEEDSNKIMGGNAMKFYNISR
jgi:L-fuconolactonase